MRILRFLGKGAGHEEKKQNCQDRIKCKVLPSGTLILALSDGCSSSKYAEKAAQSNIDVVCDIFSACNIESLIAGKCAEKDPPIDSGDHDFGDNDLKSWFGKAFMDQLKRSHEEDKKTKNEVFDKKQYCATVLFAVWGKDKTFIGHIGDGNIICFDKNSEIVYRSEEENGASSSRTYFTVSPDFNEHFRYDIIDSKNIDCIVMFSDGPQTMLKCEHGDIATGACEILAKPTINNTVSTDEALSNALRKKIACAKHYVFDDWSVIIANKIDGADADGTNKYLEKNLEPVSLLNIFKEEFRKIKFDKNGNIVTSDNNGSDVAQDAGKVYDKDCDGKSAEHPNDKSLEDIVESPVEKPGNKYDRSKKRIVEVVGLATLVYMEGKKVFLGYCKHFELKKKNITEKNTVEEKCSEKNTVEEKATKKGTAKKGSIREQSLRKRKADNHETN